MKLKKISDEIVKLQLQMDQIPYSVWTCFWETKPFMNVIGDQVSFDADYKPIPEMRKAIEWLASQFGGKVKWTIK